MAASRNTSGPGAERRGFELVTAQTLTQGATREIVSSILVGRFQPGEFLPTEDELGRQLGVSRSVVREAAKAVSMLGMIESQQGRGTIVLPSDNWNEFAPEVVEARRDLNLVDQFLVDLLEVRRTIEVEAAGLAAERATDAQLASIGGLLTDMDRVTDDPDAFAQADVSFHDAIVAATNNRPLRQLLRSIQPALLTARTLSLSSGPDGIIRSLEEHHAIYEAISTRSSATAKTLMVTHLSWTANPLPGEAETSESG
jgi:DNA-binding FadR family transcriptional regulator